MLWAPTDGNVHLPSHGYFPYHFIRWTLSGGFFFVIALNGEKRAPIVLLSLGVCIAYNKCWLCMNTNMANKVHTRIITPSILEQQKPQEASARFAFSFSSNFLLAANIISSRRCCKSFCRSFLSCDHTFLGTSDSDIEASVDEFIFDARL